LKLNKTIFTAIIAYMSLILNGCGFQSYSAKPIKPLDVSTKLELRSPNNLEFQEFLRSQNYPKSKLPITLWGENELTLSALFFHPDLNVARTLLRRAQSAEITAAQHPEIGLNGGLESHSQSIDKSPWTYRLGIDVPIITGNKREAQIAIAAGISEATRIEVAISAWNVHSRVAKSLLEYQYSLALSSILKHEVAMRNSIAEMLIKRLDVGLASNIEVSNARIALQKAEQAYLTESGRTPVLQPHFLVILVSE
jgi:outer membrane protein TolC